MRREDEQRSSDCVNFFHRLQVELDTSLNSLVCACVTEFESLSSLGSPSSICQRPPSSALLFKTRNLHLTIADTSQAARVTEVLARTGGFSTAVAKHRLYETTQHILQVTASLASIQPGGAGHQSSIRVRLLHAAVRRRILSLASQNPSYYSIPDYGIPINDLDSIGTISTFCATLIYVGFPRQGIYLRPQERLDYIALWRLVAHYIGAPSEHFETPEKAKAIMESLMLTEINPSETSRVLANNVILSLQGQPPAYASRDFLNASARWLNGDKLADALGLGKPGLYYKALVAGQCIFFCCLCYTYRSFEYLDRRKIKALRRIFWQIIVGKEYGMGEETNFEFKYVPNFDTKTKMGEYTVGLRESGIERRNLVSLVGFGVMVGVGCYLGLRAGMGLLGIGISLSS